MFTWLVTFRFLCNISGWHPVVARTLTSINLRLNNHKLGFITGLWRRIFMELTKDFGCSVSFYYIITNKTIICVISGPRALFSQTWKVPSDVFWWSRLLPTRERWIRNKTTSRYQLDCKFLLFNIICKLIEL